MDSPESNPQVSDQFCSPDADITLRSSDGVHFKFYKKQLETHSAAFANPGFLLHVKDFLDLTETAAVLDLLLQFISCQKPPSLDITFTVLTSLAEAVEKYKIFSAIPPIETSMRDAIPHHPLEVLEYAVKHNKFEIMNKAAWSSVGRGMGEGQKHLPHDLFCTWTQYCQLWWDVLDHAHRSIVLFVSDANNSRVASRICCRLGTRFEVLKDLDNEFGDDDFDEDSVHEWKESVASKVKGIPKFSDLL